MQLTLTQNNRTYHVELESATCLAIPYDYDGEQPNFFNVPKGAASPYESDDFVGCVNGNKGCEVMVINQNIHCTGTHTECAGHIQNENIFINDVLTPGYILTELISVNPIDWVDTAESYHCPVAPDEKVITRRLIKDFVSQPVPGLVIRTLPNTPEKLDRKYDESNTPFFTTEAVQYILELGVIHLVVDLPTIDKTNDGGALGNHHLFFESDPPFKKSITEFAYIPNNLIDGQYFMEIEIPPMQLDAAPSRPFLYKFAEN